MTVDQIRSTMDDLTEIASRYQQRLEDLDTTLEFLSYKPTLSQEEVSKIRLLVEKAKAEVNSFIEESKSFENIINTTTVAGISLNIDYR